MYSEMTTRRKQSRPQRCSHVLRASTNRKTDEERLDLDELNDRSGSELLPSLKSGTTADCEEDRMTSAKDSSSSSDVSDYSLTSVTSPSGRETSTALCPPTTSPCIDCTSRRLVSDDETYRGYIYEDSVYDGGVKSVSQRGSDGEELTEGQRRLRGVEGQTVSRDETESSTALLTTTAAIASDNNPVTLQHVYSQFVSSPVTSSNVTGSPETDHGHVTRLRDFVESVRCDVTSRTDDTSDGNNVQQLIALPSIEVLKHLYSWLNPQRLNSYDVVGRTAFNGFEAVNAHNSVSETSELVANENRPLDLSVSKVSRSAVVSKLSGGVGTLSTTASLIERFDTTSSMMVSIKDIGHPSPHSYTSASISWPPQQSLLLAQRPEAMLPNLLSSIAESKTKSRRDNFWSSRKWLKYSSAVSDVPTFWTQSVRPGATGVDAAVVRKRYQPASTQQASCRTSLTRDNHVISSPHRYKLDRKIFLRYRKSTRPDHKPSSAKKPLQTPHNRTAVYNKLLPNCRNRKCWPVSDRDKLLFASLDRKLKKRESPSNVIRNHQEKQEERVEQPSEMISPLLRDSKTSPTDLTSSTSDFRRRLTGLRCGGCGKRFDTLLHLTVHLEETGHVPASDVTHTSSSSLMSSERKNERRSLVPQRLVRGQDVWLSRGGEQTDRILRCMQCNAAARSLAELTLHMVHTKHYVNIVGPSIEPETQPSAITSSDLVRSRLLSLGSNDENVVDAGKLVVDRRPKKKKVPTATLR